MLAGGSCNMGCTQRIYLDFDDVICETARKLADLLFDLYGERVDYENIHAFDLSDSFNLSESRLKNLMYLAHEDPFLMSIPCADGAVEGVTLLVEMGYEPVMVTGRPAHCYSASERWLRQKGFPEMRILHVNKYGRDRGKDLPGLPVTMKPDDLLEEPFVMAVDDSPAALDILRGRVDYPLIVFDRPWNRGYPVDDRSVLRVNGWRELCDVARSVSDPHN